MTSRSEVLAVAGREVTVTNPDKVFFADADGGPITKLELVRYYVAVADGALRGAAGRPMALKRFPNGAAGDFFFQKRAPDKRPDFVRTVELSFPSGRTADEIVVDDAAALAWVVNLGCIDLNPHPVRADDLDHPDELRVDLDPVPGVPWDDVRRVALVVRDALADVGLVGWPKTSGNRGIHVNVGSRASGPSGGRRAALALAATSSAASPTSPRASVEGGAPASSSTTTRTPRIAPSPLPTPSGAADAPRLDALAGTRSRSVDAAAFTCAAWPGRFARQGDRTTAFDAAVGRLDGLLELSARHETEGSETPPGRPTTLGRSTSRPASALEAADEHEALIEIGRGREAGGRGRGPGAWKTRTRGVAAPSPADVLVDAMRGRSTTWTDPPELENVPPELRPPRSPSTRTTTVGGLRVARWAGAAEPARGRTERPSDGTRSGTSVTACGGRPPGRGDRDQRDPPASEAGVAAAPARGAASAVPDARARLKRARGANRRRRGSRA